MSDPRPIYPKHFMKLATAPRRSGFILMPFRAEFDAVHSAIREAIRHSDLTPERADDIFSTRAGLEKILRGIAESEVVVADMTGRNANVFYEVGIAHTVKDNVVLLVQDIDDLPFDLRHVDHVVYQPSIEGLAELTTKLIKIIQGLPNEPRRETVQAEAAPASQADVRQRLSLLLPRVAAEWPQTIRTLSPVATRELGSGVQKDQIQHVAEHFLEEFHGVWKPVDDLALQAISTGDAGLFWPMTRAIETAFAIQAEHRGGIRPVSGQPSLIAFCSWGLWGAAAIDQRAFGVVQTLLRSAVRFASNPDQVTSFPTYRYLAHPDATFENCIPATKIVIQTGISHAAEFGGLDSYHEALALFFFGAALSSVVQLGLNSDPMFPIWALLPDDALSVGFARLQGDPDFVAKFAMAATGLDGVELNRQWQAGIRSKLGTYAMESLMRFGRFRAADLPERFAS